MECMADEIPKAATGTKAQPVHRAFIRALLLAQSVEGYSSLCSVIATAQPPNYADIDTPVLLLAGSDDKTSPLKNVTEIYNG
jgi:alpha-beta hydrolase superfamily lysophospholipase